MSKPFQFPASNALDHHAQTCSPVARAHGDTVNSPKHLRDAITGYVEHSCRNDALGVGET